MKTIRMADLNIVTAEWVGWGSRTDTEKAARARTIIAGTDPVAIDYYGAKHLVYPFSKNKLHHDSDNHLSFIRNFPELALSSLGEELYMRLLQKFINLILKKKVDCELNWHYT